MEKERNEKTMDTGTRNMFTVRGDFHPKSDSDRLYLARRKSRSDLISFHDYIEAEENRLGLNIKIPWSPVETDEEGRHHQN